MFCHGELVRLKPAPRYLTRFYLMISLGGALGSALVGIVAPLVLPAYFELAVGLVACALLLLWQVRRDARRVRRARRRVAARRRSAAAVWSMREFYDGTIVSDAQFLRRAARAGIRRRRREPPPLADPRHDHARQPVPATRSCGAQPTTLLHGDLRHRPR